MTSLPLLRRLRIIPALPVFAAGSAWAAPEVASIVPAPGATISGLSAIEVTFSEPVSDVDADDLLVNAEAAAAVSGSGAGPYIFALTQPPGGEVSVSWDFDHGIAGTSGSGAFLPDSGWDYQLEDLVPPTVARILSDGTALDAVVPLPNAQVTSLTRVEILFSEPVTGVDANDLLIKGVPTDAVEGAGAGPYAFTLAAPPSPGIVPIAWAAGSGIADDAGNAFLGGSWFNVVLAVPPPAVRISEIMAANASGLADEDGDTPDWIEIENPGASAVTLTGWALTTDPTQPGMWVFPAASIPAGGRLVVFASGKDRKPAAGRLHTNFKLDQAGGYIGLFGPEAPRTEVAVLADYPSQRYDVSYGAPAGGGQPGFFATPTPDAANGASVLTAVTAPPTASVSRGFFAEAFPLVLSAREPGALIRFTLDGTEPTASSPVYAEPIQIASTTVLRAAAFAPDSVPSVPITHSYLFLDQVLDQPGPPYDNPARGDDDANPPLPAVGGVAFPIDWGTQTGSGFPGLIRNIGTDRVPADYGMDPEIIGDPSRYDDDGNIDEAGGITNLERIRSAFRELPLLSIVMDTGDMFGPAGLHPNSRQKGDRYEMPCSIELLLPDGTSGFSTTCGIRMHGNASREPRKCPKHGFKLNFKSTYGASDLPYALFPDSPAGSFDDIILRGDFNSSWLHWDGGTQRPKGTRLRDAFCKDTFRDMGRAAGHHRYVHLFINGLYWGTYDATEQENSTFAANTFGGSKDDYDVVEQGQLKSGTITAYNAMRSIPSPITNDRYEEMKGHLDVPWFIDYMLLHFFLGHQDWGDDINKNWYSVRKRDGGRFRYLPWDMENLMWDHRVNRVTVSNPPTGLHPKLATNEQYRLDFADRVHRHLVIPGGALTPPATIARWTEWRRLLRNAIACESARWGDYRRDVHQHQSGPYPLFTWHDQWITENERLEETWFPQRPDIVLGQLRSARLYPSVGAPVFTDADAPGGAAAPPLGSQSVAAGFRLAMARPAGTSGTIWFTTDGSDPRVYYDTTGQRTPTATAYTTPITLDAPAVVKARTLDGTTWSALMEATFSMGPAVPLVRFTEIHYHPTLSQGDSAGEFIELQNLGALAVDLSGWSLRGVDYVFPYITTLGPGARMVLASNNAPNVFAAQHPGVQVAGYFGRSLDNGGERISLLDADGRVVTAVEFDDAAPWDRAADGQGFSLELVTPGGDPHSPFSWRASRVPNGTPGTANGAAPAPPVVISEFLAINDGTIPVGTATPDFVELHNPGTAPIDLQGWSLRTRRPENAMVFPPGTVLAAGARLVVPATESADAGSPRLPLALADDWEQIALLDPAGRTVSGVRCGPQVAALAFAQFGDAWVPAVPSPGAATTGPVATAPLTSLRLNEWLADPRPGLDDWLELSNADATRPVALTGLHAGTGGHLLPFPSLAAVAPGGWVRLDCDATGRRANALPFQLPAAGATIAIADEVGAVIDSIAYGAQTAERSEGRLPDGSGPVVPLPYPSPGLPNHGQFPDSPLLNEVLVINEEGINAPWGRRSAWIEIAAPGNPGEIDLEGWRIRSVGHASQSWTFPAAPTVLAGGRHLLVWCEPGAAPGSHAGGHLNAALPIDRSLDTWGVELVNPAGQTVDRVTWGLQAADLSIGRSAPAGDWTLLASPTPGAPNAAPAELGTPDASVRFNEWFAESAGAPLDESFVELFNLGSRPVSLGGLWLSDEPSEVGRRKWRIPALSFVGARRHALFIPGNPAAHPAALPFDLAAGGEFLRLAGGGDASAVLDAVSFGRLASPEASEGSLPDGATTTSVLAPTPGAPNSNEAGPVIARHPASLAVVAGATAILEVVAPDADAFQWLRDGEPIPGANQPALVLVPVGEADRGDYACVATNASGSRTSRAARLTILHTFATWSAHFGVADPDEDTDNDLLSAFDEFLLDSDPGLPFPAGGLDGIRPSGAVERIQDGGVILSQELVVSRRAVYSRAMGRLSADLRGGGLPAEPVSVEARESGADVPDGTRRLRFRFAAPADTPRYFLHGVEFEP